MKRRTGPAGTAVLLEKHVSSRVVTEALGVNRRTLFDWVKQGKFPRPIQVGGRGKALWPLSELKDFLRRARQGGADAR